MKSISATELSGLIASGRNIELIDVRTPIEYRSIHITIARNEPLDRIDPTAIQSARNGSSGEPLYVVCRSGSRSRQACEKLIAAGVNVINVEGGTVACETAGVPVVHGKKAIPLNCQVQIITGATVIAGGVLALLTNNLYWLALPIAMGAGLVFSGITNTCAMGAILARMPWNQIKPDSNPSTKSSNETTSGCCN